MELPESPRNKSWGEMGAEVNKSWQAVTDSMKTATLELVPDLTSEELAFLEKNFWHHHVRIMEKREVFDPGITERVFNRAEEITFARRQAEQEHFDKVTLPKIKRSALLRGIFGFPPQSDV